MSSHDFPYWGQTHTVSFHKCKHLCPWDLPHSPGEQNSKQVKTRETWTAAADSYTKAIMASSFLKQAGRCAYNPLVLWSFLPPFSRDSISIFLLSKLLIDIPNWLTSDWKNSNFLPLLSRDLLSQQLSRPLCLSWKNEMGQLFHLCLRPSMGLRP